MRIAIDLLNGKGQTGNQVYTLELTKALVRVYPDEDLRALVYWNKRSEAIRAAGRSPNLRYLNSLPHDLLLGKSARSLVSKISHRIKSFVASDADVYHCTNPLNFPFGIHNGVVTLHDLIGLRHDPWCSGASQAFYRHNIARVIHEAKLVCAVSEHTRSDALGHFPQFADKFITTPLAASPVFTPSATDRAFLRYYGVADPQKPFLLSVGEIQPRKNIKGLFNAFHALPLHCRKEFQIVVVGSDRNAGNLHDLYRELAPLGNTIEWHHLQNVPVDDLVKLYNTAFAFVYLSFFEGFGLPVLEAMSCGCPVLASSTTSVGEVAADAALTVDPHDHDAVTAALMEILTNSGLRRDLQRKGLKRAADFSWEKTARLTMGGYRKVVIDTV